MNRILLLSFVFGFVLFFQGQAHAFQWNECQFTITDNPDNVGNKASAGYKIYVSQNGVDRVHDLGLSLTLGCSEILVAGDEGEFEAHATAYNDAGESDGAPIIPFTVDPAQSTPSAPGLSIGIITL